MSISSALHSAMSGLSAAGRASSVVSENLANAMTPGYARRSLLLSSNAQAGPGVQVVGVQRHSDPGILTNRRMGDAEYGMASTLAGFHARFETLVGTATDPDSIGMRLSEFESSLIAAASRPESVQRLDIVAVRAGDLAQSINDASEGLRSMRTQADHAIGAQVDRLNLTLENVQELNIRITATKSGGGNMAALLDQRQILIDEINTIVPINVVPRDRGQVALYTNGGAILLDGPAAKLNFSATPNTMPEMSVDDGTLSGLEINGVPVRMGGQHGAMPGGTLAAQFQIRDELAVSAQEDLDVVARDLIERFETPTLDATLAPGDPGLFTDNGAVFDAAQQVGQARRLQLHTSIDPALGGESWRLRAGLGAGGPGEPGDARLLQAFEQVLSDPRTVTSDTLGTGQMTAARLGSSLLSRAGQNRNLSDQSLSFASASKFELTQIELAQGVDTDAELQASFQFLRKHYHLESETPREE